MRRERELEPELESELEPECRASNMRLGPKSNGNDTKKANTRIATESPKIKASNFARPALSLVAINI